MRVVQCRTLGLIGFLLLSHFPLIGQQSGTVTGAKPPIIIPQPKVVRFTPEVFKLRNGATWELHGPSTNEKLTAALKVFNGGNIRFRKSSDKFFVLQSGAATKFRAPTAGTRPKWASEPEGYQLIVTPRGIRIVSSTAQGVFYGVQTLKQFATEQGGDRTFPAVEIEDWPAMPFRGVHWFPSASGFVMHSRLIENVFGSLKLNASVIQCEAAKWDSHPEIAAPNSISKPDLQKLVALCRSSFMEPIPLINVPGHGEWMFRNGQNLDFCEDPQTPYAYCANHPKSFEFFQDVANECLEIFHPKYFHIGHDEIAMRGRFPNPECPRCRDARMNDLMVMHANRLAEWLAHRGIAPMIWGDMLLGPGEAKDATHAKTLADAKERRERLSKRIVITDWHYTPNADSLSFELFRKEGFNTIAASWNQPRNIYALAQAVPKSGAQGLLQTTWMGYFPDEKQLSKAADQFVAFVLAAEYAWSGRQDDPSQLGYDAKEVFFRLYGEK